MHIKPHQVAGAGALKAGTRLRVDSTRIRIRPSRKNPDPNIEHTSDLDNFLPIKINLLLFSFVTKVNILILCFNFGHKYGKKLQHDLYKEFVQSILSYNMSKK